jgi:peptidylprolyl isomerase
MRGLGWGVLLASVSACAAQPVAAPPPTPIEQTLFAVEAEVDLAQMTRHERGFYFQDIVVGDGRQAQPGQTVHIAYVVRVPNGNEVDRAEPERPLMFKLGERQSIPALEATLRSMKVGGVRQLVIPPDLAYGPRGRGKVPPNATLVMIVRLVKVE